MCNSTLLYKACAFYITKLHHISLFQLTIYSFPKLPINFIILPDLKLNRIKINLKCNVFEKRRLGDIQHYFPPINSIQ